MTTLLIYVFMGIGIYSIFNKNQKNTKPTKRRKRK